MSYPAPALDREGELRSLSTAPVLYTGAMNTNEPAPRIRRRKPRGRPIVPCGYGGGGTADGGNNYLAETPKNPVGAKPGNRNALVHGRCGADWIALRRKIDDLKRRVAALIAEVDSRL